MADRDHLGRFVKNHAPLYFGKKHTEETKKKISKSSIGKKHSNKTKKKISEWGIKNSQIKRAAGIKGNIAASKSSETNIEKILYEYLLYKNIKFEKQHNINNRFVVDAYVPSLNLVIEADGNYWHSLDKIKKKDKAENAYLKACGYKVIRLSEKDILSGKFKEILEA